MTHPLTDEMMRKIHGNRPGYSNPFDEDDMRAAADWQLQQVIEWLNAAIAISDQSIWPHQIDALPRRLQKAMRPQQQQQQEDN